MLTETQRILKDDEAKKYYEELKEKGLILFEAIVGSQAYGTALPTSDIDKKFIYIDTYEKILNGTYTIQLNIDKDYTGYEIGRYLELLKSSNPNLIELIWQTDDTILFCDPIFKKLIIDKKEEFLSKQISESFGHYAKTQIEKARGLNKKILNPLPEERKGLLDFCWVGSKQGSISLKDWLKQNMLEEKFCGCIAIDHMKNYYHLVADWELHDSTIKQAKEIAFKNMPWYLQIWYGIKFTRGWPKKYQKIFAEIYYTLFEEKFEKLKTNGYKFKYKGIVDKDNVQILTSSVEKDAEVEVTFFANMEGYSKYCKDYREYWDWVEKRNEERYQTNQSHGAQYDSKNMMHCHRLLDMAIEILATKKVIVRRPNREQLLEIRAGKYSYDTLLTDARTKMDTIDSMVMVSDLPEKLESKLIIDLLGRFRREFYKL